MMVERMLADAAHAYGLRSVSLRYFNAADASPDCDIGEAHDPETRPVTGRMIFQRDCQRCRSKPVELKPAIQNLFLNPLPSFIFRIVHFNNSSGNTNNYGIIRKNSAYHSIGTNDTAIAQDGPGLYASPHTNIAIFPYSCFLPYHRLPEYWNVNFLMMMFNIRDRRKSQDERSLTNANFPHASDVKILLNGDIIMNKYFSLTMAFSPKPRKNSYLFSHVNSTRLH
ncbi:hypothetical protein VAPA_1c20700 [Variovorax paradoxus B4]|uniref:Uncharacterized protein n=1 Tax=Variovorax paradoxus B4 TaxID=1246301 RepID=T1XA38_VARPD|nr:hypothetical protein VAPA_1c20700 [Variovorax paradoxus B4]